MDDIREDNKSHVRNNNLESKKKVTFENHAIKHFTGIIKIIQMIFTLLAWSLCSNFKENSKDKDSDVIVFFLIVVVTAWLYAISSIVITILRTRSATHDLIRKIVIICCSLAFAVFCLVTSSLLADYARSLRKTRHYCAAMQGTSCGHLEAAVVFGFMAMIVFLMDAIYELKNLRKIKERCALSKKTQENLDSSQ